MRDCCRECNYSHLMVCSCQGDNYGKNTLLILHNNNDCNNYIERKLSKKEKKLYWQDIEDERMETREYYDMTGCGDYIRKIGFVR